MKKAIFRNGLKDVSLCNYDFCSVMRQASLTLNRPRRKRAEQSNSDTEDFIGVGSKVDLCSGNICADRATATPSGCRQLLMTGAGAAMYFAGTAFCLSRDTLRRRMRSTASKPGASLAISCVQESILRLGLPLRIAPSHGCPLQHQLRQTRSRRPLPRTVQRAHKCRASEDRGNSTSSVLIVRLTQMHIAG
jgi:hypothetical protein